MPDTKQIANTEDMIDVRDIIARFEALEETDDDGEKEELAELTTVLNDLKGNGGDEDWRGDWYPLTLVRDSYFRQFAEQEAEDLDLIPKDACWPATCIDWEQAAHELQMDYTSFEFDGVTYWYR